MSVSTAIFASPQPIEEFLSKIKSGIRRYTLSANDILSDRICESVQKVSRADCQAWIIRCHSSLGVRL